MMAGRVYPRDSDSPPVSGEHSNSDSPPLTSMHRPTMSQDSLMSKESYPFYDRATGPPNGTYVVQIPKDQVYRVPPPENAHKFQQYTRKKNNRNGCRCCVCATLLTAIILVILIAVSVGVFYFLCRPKMTSYSVQSVSIKGINLNSTSRSATVSPQFDVTVHAQNPNGKIGIYYEQGSALTVYHNGVKLCDGSMPAFYQPPSNVTDVLTELVGSEIVLSSGTRQTMLREQKKKQVPLNVNVKVPVKIKVGAVKTWTITVKVACDVTVDSLTASAKVVSKSCDVSVTPW